MRTRYHAAMMIKGLRERLKNIELKFTSGNSIPVERAVITRDDYDALKAIMGGNARLTQEDPQSDEKTPFIEWSTCDGRDVRIMRDPDSPGGWMLMESIAGRLTYLGPLSLAANMAIVPLDSTTH